MDKKRYPLFQAQEIEKAIRAFKKLHLDYSNLIEKDETADLTFLYDKEFPSFFFRVFKPNIMQNSAFFYFEYFPQSAEKYEKIVHNADLKAATDHFFHWKNIIEAYNIIQFTEEEAFIHQYEEEFYSEFEILDDDANINTFSDFQQRFIYNYLQAVIKELNKIDNPDNIVTEIILDTEYLMNNVQNQTKRVLIKNMGKIFARIKKFSLKLSMDIFDVAKKEIMKKVLYSGFEEAKILIDLFL